MYKVTDLDVNRDIQILNKIFLIKESTMLSVTKNIIYSKYIFFRLYKLFILFHFDYKNEF